MKILTAGHRYELDNYEDSSGPGQTIQFIEKQLIPGPIPGKPELTTFRDGTTNEEVLAVLIDRMLTLSAKLPSRETSIAITKCEEALLWLEKRTADRKKRAVEGTNNP